MTDIDLPPWHPEGWSEDYRLDEHLEALNRRVWPRNQWLSVEDCPRLTLDPLESYGEAMGALRRMRREARAELRSLRYGPVLMNTPSADRPKSRRKARLHLLALWILYRPCPCRCGAYHVRAIFDWRSRASR